MYTKVIAIRAERIAEQKAVINAFITQNKAAIQTQIQKGGVIPLYNALKAIDGADSLKDQLLRLAAQNFSTQLEIQILEGDDVAKESLDKLSIEENNVLAKYGCPNKDSWLRAKSIRSILNGIDITNNNSYSDSEIDQIKTLLNELSPVSGDAKVVTYGVGRNRRTYTRQELLERLWNKVPTDTQDKIFEANPKISKEYFFSLLTEFCRFKNADIADPQNIGDGSDNVREIGKQSLVKLREGLLGKYMDSKYKGLHSDSKKLISNVLGFLVDKPHTETVSDEMREEIIQNYDLLMDMYNAANNVGGLYNSRGEVNPAIKLIGLDPSNKHEVLMLSKLILGLSGMKAEIQELRKAS